MASTIGIPLSLTGADSRTSPRSGNWGWRSIWPSWGEKRAILDALLARFNDGRRKTLFNTAVYLLPLEDLQSVMADLNSRTELAGQSVKERALAAVELVQQAADRRGRQSEVKQETEKG